MTEIEKYFDDLLDQVCKLEEKFIHAYFPVDPLLSPADYGFDVHAYCVLVHAAMEEFVERVALRVMDQKIEAWMLRREMSETLLLLVSYYRHKITTSDNPGKGTWTIFDHIRHALDDVKDKFSKDIRANHGVSLKYLVNLLIPVGIEVTRDPNLLNSLAQLAKARGDYAHANKGVKLTLAPEDARTYAFDCLLLLDDIRAKAVKVLR